MPILIVKSSHDGGDRLTKLLLFLDELFNILVIYWLFIHYSVFHNKMNIIVYMTISAFSCLFNILRFFCCTEIAG